MEIWVKNEMKWEEWKRREADWDRFFQIQELNESISRTLKEIGDKIFKFLKINILMLYQLSKQFNSSIFKVKIIQLINLHYLKII